MSVANKGSIKKNFGFFPTHDFHLIKFFLSKILIAKGREISGSRSWDLGQGDLLKLIL